MGRVPERVGTRRGVSGNHFGNRSTLTALIVETVRTHPGIRTGAIVDATRARRATVLIALEEMRRQGALEATSGPRGARQWWLRVARRPNTLTPLSASPVFVGELRQELNRQIPGGFGHGELALHVNAGRVQAPSFTRHTDGAEGGWPAPSFAGDIRAWLQRRTPGDWWGFIKVQVEKSKATTVIVARSFR